MPRIFSLDEANALLPRLSEILGEMRERQPALARLREELAAMGRKMSGNGHLAGRELHDKREQAEAIAGQLNELIAEVTAFGCELKGLDQGLIDFPTEREGRTVYLCWRLGEEEIAHWHDIEAGFAGRQRL